MIANLLDRAWFPVWRFLEWLYPLDVSVQRGVDACPVAGVAAGQSERAVSDSPLSPALSRPEYLTVGDWADICGCGRPEPTEELLLAAANSLDEYSRHLRFNLQRQDYLHGLVRDLRDRATLFAQNR